MKRKVSIAILGLIILMGIACLFRPTNKTISKVLLQGETINFYATYQSSGWKNEYGYLGKRLGLSYGGKELTVKYIGDRKLLDSDIIKYKYDFEDQNVFGDVEEIIVTGEEQGIGNDNVVIKFKSGNFLINSKEEYVIDIAINDEWETIVLTKKTN